MAAPSLQPHEWQVGVFGFRLAPPRLVGGRNHVVEPVPFLSQQISSTAELTYTDINREREVAFAMDRFSGGLADTLRFNLEQQTKIRWSKNADTSFPGYVLPGPKVTTIGATIAVKPTLGVQRGSVTYVAAGANLYQVTTSAVTLDTTFAATITALFVWGGNLIVGLGDGVDFQYRAGDVSGSAFTGGGQRGRFLTAIGDVLWRKTANANEVAAADQVGGPWATYDVGDSSYPITSLGVLDQALLVGKEDGLHGLDTDGVATALTPELRLQADAQVGKVALAFNRDYYFSSRWGVVRVRPSEGLRHVGLDTLADPALPGSPAEPRPTAFTSDGRFLYALVVPPAKEGVYVWKRGLDDTWHNYLYRTDLGGAGLASADLLFATGKIGATATNAILFAYQPTAGNYQLAYARFPRTTDPTRDSDYQFETAVKSTLRTLDYVASYPTVAKFSDRLKVVGDDLSATRKATARANVDNDAAKTLGDFQKSPFEDVALTSPLDFHRLSLELDLSSEAATAPKLRAFHLSCALLGRVVRKHTVHLLAASAAPLATGGRSRSDYAAVVDTLRNLVVNRAAQACVDEDGREFVAYLEDVTETTAEERVGPGFTPLKILSCVLKEIAV